MDLNPGEICCENKKQNEGNRIVMVGSLDENKNQGFSIENFKIVQSIFGAQCKLDVIGDGPLRAKLKGMIRDGALSENIKLLGQLEHKQVLQHIEAANFLLHTSKYETFSVAALEALAVGTPVVSSDCKGIQSWMPEEFGETFQLNDLVSFEVALRKIKENKPNSLKMSNWVKKNLGVDTYKEQYKMIYEIGKKCVDF